MAASPEERNRSGRLASPVRSRRPAPAGAAGACRDVAAGTGRLRITPVVRPAPRRRGPDGMLGGVVDSRYRILESLGAGGTARVYRAEDLRLGRTVALKLLHRNLANDRESTERFAREARVAAGLHHPNVVAIYDQGEWGGTPYIVMEHVAGRSLLDVVREEAPLEPRRAVDFAGQVLSAVRFIHRRGIIHRDLKPANALIDRSGCLKLTDFGIAVGGPSGSSPADSVVGTLRYASPEQADGLPVTPASDLYSVGVVLYELLAGRAPFEEGSAPALALQHVREQPLPPSEFNPAVPPELDSTVLRALEKDPANRFPHADAFLEALEHVRPSPAWEPRLRRNGARRLSWLLSGAG